MFALLYFFLHMRSSGTVAYVKQPYLGEEAENKAVSRMFPPNRCFGLRRVLFLCKVMFMLYGK